MSASNRYSGHGHFLGNGGQAIEIEGRLFTRDLYEHNVHLHPFCEVTAEDRQTDLYKSLQRRIFELDFPKTLELPVQTLSDKLFNLEQLSENLGQILLEAMHCYQWEAVPFALPLTHETPGKEPETRWVQVANRLRRKIYVSEEPWQRFHSMPRTTLMIHEAVYSLVKPKRLAPQLYQQLGATARKITAQMFMEKTYRDPAAKESFLQDLTALNLTKAEDTRLQKRVPEFFPYLTQSGFEQLALRA